MGWEEELFTWTESARARVKFGVPELTATTAATKHLSKSPEQRRAMNIFVNLASVETTPLLAGLSTMVTKLKEVVNLNFSWGRNVSSHQAFDEVRMFSIYAGSCPEGEVRMG